MCRQRKEQGRWREGREGCVRETGRGREKHSQKGREKKKGIKGEERERMGARKTDLRDRNQDRRKVQRD